jgi:AcrR family transcriptional regulator
MGSQTRLGKQHLLEVAEHLFTEYGYQTVSIRDIAQQAGVTNAALYYHFPNKEALFDEVLKNHATKLGEKMLQAGSAVESTREKVAKILDEYAQMVAERRSPLFLLRRKPPPSEINHEEARHKHAELVKIMLAPLQDVLEEAVLSGELRPLPDQHAAASLLLGLFHGMLQHRKSCQDCDLTSEDIEVVIEIFWDGLRQ